MILTRHFVFLHVPKTGGSWLRRLLTEHAPADWEVEVVGWHPGVAQIPPSHRELPRLGATRNPWSWYVSFYHYELQRRRGPDELFLEWSDGATLDFVRTTHRMLDWVARFRPDLGGFSYQVVHMFGENHIGETRFVKMESLRDDLIEAIGDVVALPPALEDAMRSAPAINTTAKDHFASAYDRELEERIARADAKAFEFFGYEPRLDAYGPEGAGPGAA